MIVDLAKIWTDVDVINVEIIGFDSDKKRIIRDMFQYTEELMDRHIELRFVAVGKGDVQIAPGTWSASYVGKDCWESHKRARGAAIEFLPRHLSEDNLRVAKHELGHFWGCKHPHEIDPLLERDPDRYALITDTPEDSILMYGSGIKIFTPNDIAFFRQYPKWQELSKNYLEKDRARCKCLFD